MRVLIGVALALLTQTAAAQMTGPQAFDDGKAFGSSMNSGIQSNINAAKAGEVLKDFTTSAPQSSYWQGSQTPLSGVLSGGMNTVIDCDANIAGMTDPQQRQHCEAVNYMNRLPTVKPPPMVTKTDPLYTTGRAIAADPQTIAGTMQGTYSGCTTRTVTNAAETVDQTCEEYTTTENPKCQIGQIVQVDPDHLYKCLETIKVLSDQKCTVGRVVLVSPEYNYQCIQNQYQIDTLQCNKIAGVTIGSSTALNCTPGTLYSGNGGYGNIYCVNETTFRYTISYIHPYCPTPAFDFIVSNPYPATTSWDGGWYKCPGRSFYVRAYFSCSGATCTLSKCFNGSGVPDGCWSQVVARPYSYTVPTATVAWDNQCTALEARAL